MKTCTLLDADPGTVGPHLYQVARDRLEDTGLIYAEHPVGSYGAVHTEAVTAS